MPVAASPPNLREEICNNKGRRKPAAEDEDNDAGAPADAAGGPNFLLCSVHAPTPKASELLTSGLASPPIDVHVGPPNKWVAPASAMAAEEPVKRKPKAQPTPPSPRPVKPARPPRLPRRPKSRSPSPRRSPPRAREQAEIGSRRQAEIAAGGYQACRQAEAQARGGHQAEACAADAQ